MTLRYTARMPDGPLAYHITIGTYGTRLHGDPRGTVDRSINKPGDPIIGKNEDWQRIERSQLRFPPVTLTMQQRRFAEDAIRGVCKRGGWQLYVCTAQADHVHVLLTTDRDGKAVRSWLKTWLGQALTKRFASEPPTVSADRPHSGRRGSDSPRRPWWAKGGSVKWVWDERYFENVFDYITRHRTGTAQSRPAADATP